MDVNSVSKTANAGYASGTEATGKTSGVSGRKVGDAKLSDAGKKYYDELKSKYKDMEFILVSKDKKAEAQANMAAYAATSSKTVVLIDDEKVERMAADEDYRKKYEGIIDSASKQIPELKKALENVPGVKGFGINVNDKGEVSFFAAMEKGNKLIAERQEKKLKAKKAEKKAEAKRDKAKAEEKKKAEKLEEKRTKKADKEEKLSDKYDKIEASSVEELLSRISEYQFNQRSDSIMTPEESLLGGHVDFSM